MFQHQLKYFPSLPGTDIYVLELMKQFYGQSRIALLGVDVYRFKGISLKLLAKEQFLVQHPEWNEKLYAGITKPSIGLYVWLHYPTIAISQAASFVFMKDKVQMISDC
ncbi:hypothetical protein M5K25_019978 [Dendrobium thyrsiflorum]|uniref:Phytochrome chromophore attachment site domain-containing protein n=1 Tax=Dendrobium thyrsiflorum TaxID=117978 RepID=A0ABD0UN40_DENTH